jgi:hypothetical protein
MAAITPLHKWLIANGETTTSLARALKISRPRVSFWVQGATCPRGQLLDTLLTLTGLTVRQLVPNPDIQTVRRIREKNRREHGPVKRKPKPKSQLLIKVDRAIRIVQAAAKRGREARQ